MGGIQQPQSRRNTVSRTVISNQNPYRIMHLPSLFSKGMLSMTLVVGLLLASPGISSAKDKKHHHHSSRHTTSRYSHHHYSRDVYFSYPRTSWVVSLGTGYAGRGYYYGPPNA